MLVGVKILVIRANTDRVNDSLLGKTYKYFPEACNITPAFDNDSVIGVSAMTWEKPT